MVEGFHSQRLIAETVLPRQIAATFAVRNAGIIPEFLPEKMDHHIVDRFLSVCTAGPAQSVLRHESGGITRFFQNPIKVVYRRSKIRDPNFEIRICFEFRVSNFEFRGNDRRGTNDATIEKTGQTGTFSSIIALALLADSYGTTSSHFRDSVRSIKATGYVVDGTADECLRQSGRSF